MKIGTRGSQLARWQADWTAAQLQQFGVAAEIVVIHTSGDAVQDQTVINIGAQGVFTKEIQRALLDGAVDIAVHSCKDLPTEMVDGLLLAAVPKRESVRDMLVSLQAEDIADLPEGSRIGTDSLRRKTQLLYKFGNKYRIDSIRGNVETRLRKIRSGEYDAVILAEAGLKRLGFLSKEQNVQRNETSRQYISPLTFLLPAVGQGALGIETRTDDAATIRIVKQLSDAASMAAVLAERAMLRTLQGGCSAPIAALAAVADRELKLHGRILTTDGTKQFDHIQTQPTDGSPETLGICVAQKLLEWIR